MLAVGFQNMLSPILRNVNKICVSSAPFNRFYRNGGSTTPFINNENAQGLHLSSISFAVKDPPKRPLSPYLSFLMKRRPVIMKEQPGLKMPEITKIAAADWVALPLQEKKPYEDNYKTELDKFKALKEHWSNSLTLKQKAELQDLRRKAKKVKDERAIKRELRLLNKPKRPLNSYNYFVAQIDKSAIKSGQTVLTCAMELWKSMTDADKRPFIDLANKDRERYEKEMLAWEEKMIKGGYDVVIRKKSKGTVDTI